MMARKIAVRLYSEFGEQFDHRGGGPTSTALMRRFLFPGLAVLLLAGACAQSGAGPSTTVEQTSPASVTTTPPSTAASTTTEAVASTTTEAATTTSVSVEADTLALGTLQVGFVPLGDGAILPQPPVSLSMTITEAGAERLVYTFEDPDPGWVFEEGVISLTISTFVLPLPPGEYEITNVEVDDTSFAPEPVDIPMLAFPTFTVLEDVECTFIGELTVLSFRLPPGELDETTELVQEVVGPEGALLVFLPDTGSVLAGDLGLSLLEGVLEADLSGSAWWLDGNLVDESNCVTQLAQFQ